MSAESPSRMIIYQVNNFRHHSLNWFHPAHIFLIYLSFTYTLYRCECGQCIVQPTPIECLCVWVYSFLRKLSFGKANIWIPPFLAVELLLHPQRSNSSWRCYTVRCWVSFNTNRLWFSCLSILNSFYKDLLKVKLSSVLNSASVYLPSPLQCTRMTSLGAASVSFPKYA